MPDREPPRVFVTYAHDTEEHKEQVRRFATFLHTRIGLEVRLDQRSDGERLDWSLWAAENLREADFVLVIASPLYKQRAEGRAAPHEGRGAQYETSIIRNRLTGNLQEATRQFLPVVLPGRSVEEIPEFLNAYSTTRYKIAEFTRDGVADLIAAITGRGRYTTPRRGIWLDGDEPPVERVPASALPWLDSGGDVRRGTASIDGVCYADSIVLRPRTRPSAARGYVEVDLGGLYQRLTAVAGVLDDAADTFQVGRFRVFFDGTPQAEHQVSLGKPAEIDLDVTGVLRLRLEMSRPGTPPSPLGSAAVTFPHRPGRPPELACGDPMVS